MADTDDMANVKTFALKCYRDKFGINRHRADGLNPYFDVFTTGLVAAITADDSSWSPSFPTDEV